MRNVRNAFITGVAGEALTPEETAFLGSAVPAGLILFARNCKTRDQVRRLVASAKEAAGSADLLVLVDQEGGRVQRLAPPLARALPPAAAYGRLYEEDAEGACEAAFLTARLVAEELKDLAINTDCAPVLDVPVAGAHAVIGDRAYAHTPERVAALGRAVADGFLAGGVLPVLKHIPGHGRAMADSHFALPVVSAPRDVLSATDFAPFRALAHMPAAMSAHVVFAAVDADAPASASATVTRSVIRGEIGFDGLLISDDVSMKALSGTLRERAEAVIRAGSDLVLHCNGDLAEMEDVAAGVPRLAGRALERFVRALHVRDTCEPFDVARAEACLARALAIVSRQAESV
jgi:beta-N-acetylhexosaminidase